VSSRKPFGLATTFKGKVAKRVGDILVYQNGGTGYIPRKSISTGVELIDKWKVYIRASRATKGSRIMGSMTPWSEGSKAGSGSGWRNCPGEEIGNRQVAVSDSRV
jgi:hypothetical protein